MDLALDNLQKLLYHETQPTKQTNSVYILVCVYTICLYGNV